MDQYDSMNHSSESRHGLLRDRIRLVKRKDCNRYDVVPIEGSLSFEKGFYVVLRACQLLAQSNDGIILVGVAGPSGAGKTVFTDKILDFLPDVAVISMDNYNDPSRIVDKNFDDPRITDYSTLLENIGGLKEGRSVEVPIYDFKASSRVGYRTVDVPSSRIVILEGIYALSDKLRPLLDLRVCVTGGVHFDLLKRVLRDIQRAGQGPEEIVYQITETVYPMYKAFIEPDLQTAHIKIKNKFNPFTGFQNPTYTLKSTKTVSVDQIKSVLSEEHEEDREETCDIYLLPPGEDPETCHSYLRMRNKDGKYNLMFEEWVTDNPFIISPRITFQVGVRLLGGLMALGYSIAAILKRNSHVFSDDRVVVKLDWLEQLNHCYIQVEGKERKSVKYIAEQLGLEGSYIPHTYIEQIQLEKLVNESMALPDELQRKLSPYDEMVFSPREAPEQASRNTVLMENKNSTRVMSHSYSSHEDKSVAKLTALTINDSSEEHAFESSAIDQESAQLSEQISTLNERIYVLSSQMEELSSMFSSQKIVANPQRLLPESETLPTSLSASNQGNATLLPSSSSSPKLNKDLTLTNELQLITQGHHQIMQRLSSISTLVSEHLTKQQRIQSKNKPLDFMFIGTPFMIMVVGGIGSFLLKRFKQH
ncbi:inorganic pyrophosphatase TTM2-like [Curcuma longa]|uniref:inorganic pyrophosphatase TTM2-like n=1 Tax=Curcuma longa TaxID=136217 RepID=UPI003D9F50DC